MEMTYSYNVISLATDDSKADGFVFGVVIELVGKTTVDGVDYEASTMLSENYTYDDAQTLIPYADLTQDQVIGWVETSMGSDRIAKFKKSIEKKLQNKLNTIENKPLPWS